MLGYTRDTTTKIKSSFVDPALSFDNPIKETSYINLFVTIEPQLDVPEAFRESVRENEMASLNIYIVKF